MRSGPTLADTVHLVSETKPERRTVLVAPAWPYANGPRHIGHVAGFAVPADVLARFERLRGSRVLMASGTDEHGTPITYEADKKGIAPREFVDQNSATIVEDLRRLGMTYDIFTRTTTRNHYRVTQDLFLKLYEKGYLIAKKQLGAFDPVSGRTLPDRYIEGKCPICGFPEARGDQCDNCGNQLDPVDLIDPRSIIDGSTPEFRETKHLFLDLPASVEWAYNRGTPDAWREWWQNADSGHFYFMGKDNIVFHSVIWPAMLLGYDGGGELGAAKGDLHLPTN